jgi:hypothetical protein
MISEAGERYVPVRLQWCSAQASLQAALTHDLVLITCGITLAIMLVVF